MNMSNQKRVVVTISPLGVPKVEAQNFYGSSCETATGPIERALAAGNGGVTRELKGEYYEEAPAGTEQATQNW